jgi:hypothetical protein
MKRQIRLGEDTYKVQGKAFKEAYILLEKTMIFEEGGPISQSETDINLQALRVQISVEQEGAKATTSFNAVGPVVKYALYNPEPTSYQNHLFDSNGTSCRGLFTGTSTSLVKIPLLETFILKGGDCITFNVSTLSTLWGQNVDANSSGIYLVIEEGSDLEQLDINLPCYEPITIDKQSPSWQYNAVSRIAILNGTNDGGMIPLTYTNPVNYVEITSQHVSERFDINQQFIKAFDLGKTDSDNLRSYRLYDVEPSALTDVTINMGVDTSLVSTGACFLYVEKVVVDKGLVIRGIAHSQKVKDSKLKFRGFGKGGSRQTLS